MRGTRHFLPSSFLACLLAVVLAGPVSAQSSEPKSEAAKKSPYDTEEFRANWALAAVNALPAYDLGATGKGQIVAVIDTGIDIDHDELKDIWSPLSRDMITDRKPGPSIDDIQGHGSLISGSIAASRNGRGVHGLAFGAKIMALRVWRDDAQDICPLFNTQCANDFNAVIRAVDVAIDAGVKVISASLVNVSRLPNQPSLGEIADAFARASEAGIFVSLVATNGGFDEPPENITAIAADPRIRGTAIITGAVNQDLERGTWGNRAGSVSQSAAAGKYADIFLAAPGIYVISTWPNNNRISRTSGTSQAQPYVAAAAAILLSVDPTLTNRDIFNILTRTAKDLGEPGPDPIYGMGLLDVGAAVQSIAK